MLGTILFNIYLDYFIQNKTLLKDLAVKHYLLAFADDLLIESGNKENAVAALNAIGTFENLGLVINV